MHGKRNGNVCIMVIYVTISRAPKLDSEEEPDVLTYRFTLSLETFATTNSVIYRRRVCKTCVNVSVYPCILHRRNIYRHLGAIVAE